MNRIKRKGLIVILLIFFTAGGSLLNDLSLYSPDSARYMIWARSLAHFEGFKDATSPDVQRYVVHAPLYAVLLAPVARIFPSDLEAAKCWTLLFGLGSILALYFWLRRSSGDHAGRIGAFLLASNALFMLYSTEVLSDVPFLLAIIAFFWLNERKAGEPETFSHTVGLAVVVACGMLLREVGIALLISQIIYLLLKNERRNALIVAEISIAVFLLWVMRNEWYIAGREQPALTNTKLFFHHFFTSVDDSILKEIVERVGVNATLYGKILGGLLFYPTLGPFSYDILYRNSASYATLFSMTQAAAIPLTLLAAIGVVYGFMVDKKRSASFMLRILFLIVYALIILCYPINDIRFMLPVAMLGVYYCAVALAAVIERLSALGFGWGRYVLFVILLVVGLPNILWIQKAIAANRSYHAFYAGRPGADTLRTGGNFAKPAGRVAEWIRGNTPADAVIMSQTKDYAYCIGDRKLVNVNETLTLDNFEYYLRDYHIGYLVASVQSIDVPEFAFQMHQSHRYAFTPVHHIGRIFIYQVKPYNATTPDQESATIFGRGLSQLDDGKYEDAARTFDELRMTDTLNYPALFYAAVAREFSGNLGQAEAMFSQFTLLPQSGMYLDRSATHREIIRMLIRMDPTIPPNTRAEQFASIGASCWEMGFHGRAKELLTRATALDPNCYSAALFGMYFSLQSGDTAAARSLMLKARSIQPRAKAMPALSQVFDRFDSLSKTTNGEERQRNLMAIATAFTEAGLVENAIDTYLLVLNEDPKHTAALQGLAALYETKRRFAPAMEILNRITLLQPTDGLTRKKIGELATYF